MPIPSIIPGAWDSHMDLDAPQPPIFSSDCCLGILIPHSTCGIWGHIWGQRVSGFAAGHTKHCTLRHRKETEAKTRILLKNQGGLVRATGSFAGQCPPSPPRWEINEGRVKGETTSTSLQNATPHPNIRLALRSLFSMGRDRNLSPL